MDVNYLAVLIASIAEFIIGAIWYMPLFGKAWGEIHGFDKLSATQKRKAQKNMMPMLGIQFVGTVITTFILAKFINLIPNYSVYSLAVLAWVGFIVPIQISAIIFGGTDAKWVFKKTLIMAGGALACLLVAAAILNAFN